MNTDNKALADRLSRPMTRSQFGSAGDMIEALLREREEAATALTATPSAQAGEVAQPQGDASPNADRMAIKMLVAAGFVTEAKANEALSIAHGFDKGPLTPRAHEPAPTADGFALDKIGWIIQQLDAPERAAYSKYRGIEAIRHVALRLQSRLERPTADGGAVARTGPGDVWDDWSRTLRRLIGDRTETLHFAADVQATDDGVRFDNCRFVAHPAPAPDVARLWSFVEQRFDAAKTSASERVLEGLGLSTDDAEMPLSWHINREQQGATNGQE